MEQARADEQEDQVGAASIAIERHLHGQQWGRGAEFPQHEGDEQDDDLLFVTNARAAIAQGKTVYYDSWW